MYEDIKNKASQPPRFIGYTVIHRYRANNNAGQAVFGDGMCIMNEDLSEVVRYYDAEDADFKYIIEMIGRIKDEISEGK